MPQGKSYEWPLTKENKTNIDEGVDMKESLPDLFDSLTKKYRLDSNNQFSANDIYSTLHSLLKKFTLNHKNPAIYCNGEHTEMLMADFIADMKNVSYIIDNYSSDECQKGFEIITKKDIPSKNIDGVIISTYRYKDAIKADMAALFPNVDTLDIYDEMAKAGIELHREYYLSVHPYSQYSEINAIKRRISKGEIADIDGSRLLIEKFLQIKDFRLAKQRAQHLFKLSGKEEDSSLYKDVSTLCGEILCPLCRKSAIFFDEGRIIFPTLTLFPRQPLKV